MQRKGSLFLCVFLCLGTACLVFAGDEFVYDAKGKRDPFIALVTPEGRLLKLDDEVAQNTAISLEGIIYDPRGLSFALVNAEPVKVGDYVGEFQVLRIEKTKVVFIKAGEISEVVIKKEE